jgi:hypothetical protein
MSRVFAYQFPPNPFSGILKDSAVSIGHSTSPLREPVLRELANPFLRSA